MQEFGEGGVRHESLMRGRGAREARENFCGVHSYFSTDCIYRGIVCTLRVLTRVVR